MQQSTVHLAAEYEAKAAAIDSDPTSAKPEPNAADADVIMTDGSSALEIPFVVDPAESASLISGVKAEDGQPELPAGTTPTTIAGVRLPEAPAFDVRFEASKTPLDLAIFHSIQASTAGAGAGGPDRLKKMLSCILVVGGTALTPGMLGALDSR